MSTEQEGNSNYIDNISNSELRAKWGLPDDIDPYEVELEELNPANNDWFGKNLDLDVFKRLRDESQIPLT